MAGDDILDGLLSQAAAKREVPSEALMRRILADADALQPQPPTPAARPAPPSAAPLGWFGTLADWFGGGISLAGMTAAAATGLYLGVAQPASVLALAETVTGTTAIESIDLLPGSGTFWSQE